MIVKNLEAVARMIVHLESILETDNSVSNVDKKWIYEAQVCLQRVTGMKKVSPEENMKVLGYGQASE